MQSHVKSSKLNRKISEATNCLNICKLTQFAILKAVTDVTYPIRNALRKKRDCVGGVVFFLCGKGSVVVE